MHVIADNKHIAVEYCFTKDDVGGKQPAAKKVWAVIKFQNPKTKSVERLRVAEPQSILEASEKEILSFIEHEVECYFRHCDEDAEVF